MRRRPMNNTFHLSTFGILAQSIGVIGAPELYDIPVRILDHGIATNDISAPQANFTSGGEAFEILWRDFHKIVAIDVQLSLEIQSTLAQRLIFGVSGEGEGFG